jgi:transposase
MKYIGLDAHSRECFFVVLGKGKRVLRRAAVKTSETELLDFVRSVKGRKKLAFEEGMVSQWLYLLLKDEVDELVVCQPQERRGAKTDKIDAGEIADLLRVGRLKPVFHSDDAFMELRALVSGYGDVAQELVRAKNRYRALFRQSAIVQPGTGLFKSTEAIAQLPTEALRYVACPLLEQIWMLEEHKRGYEERFEENARRYKPIRLIMSIPGFGPVRANQVTGIVVTPHRFPDKYHFFSYAMLVKHKQISGGKEYGKKRAHGQTVLKDVFKTAVFSVLKSDNAFRRKYEATLAQGRDARAARNAVARMLAATVLGVWKSGKKYNDKHMEVTRRRNQSCHSGI